MKDYTNLIARASPPEILFQEDIGSLLDIAPLEAERRARAGELGPAFYLKGRVAVLRDDLMHVLRLRAGAPERDDREVLP
jgi:hypothetical protein